MEAHDADLFRWTKGTVPEAGKSLLILLDGSDPSQLHAPDAASTDAWSPRHADFLRSLSPRVVIVVAPDARLPLLDGPCRDLAERGVPVGTVRVPGASFEGWAREQRSWETIVEYMKENTRLYAHPTPDPDPPGRGTTSPPNGEALLDTPTLGQGVFDALPTSLRDLAGLFPDERKRDVFLVTALGALSGALPNFVGQYSGSELGPNLFVFVSAPPASGKGVAVYARRLVQDIEDDVASDYRSDLANYKEALKKAKGEKPEPPIRKRHLIPGDASAAAVMDALTINGRGTIFETEADSLTKTFTQDWGGLSDLFRKAFHHEPASDLRLSGSREVHRPELSVVLTGTPDQLTHLMPGVGNGLVSRFTFYVFTPPVDGKWESPRPGPASRLNPAMKEAAQWVAAMHSALAGRFEWLTFEVRSELWDRFDEGLASFKNTLTKRFKHHGAAAGNRLGVQVFRYAMVLAAVRRWGELGDLGEVDVLEATEDDVTAAVELGRCFAAHAEAALRSLPDNAASPKLTGKRGTLWELLPPSFSRAEAHAVAERLMVPDRTLTDWLSKWVQEGSLEKSERGAYQKQGGAET